jgi:mono/diheme cytochrome c family protein
LDPPPANFTDPEFMRGVAPFDLFNIIAVGRSGSAMPSWEDVLSIQDRWDVVSYLWAVHPGAIVSPWDKASSMRTVPAVTGPALMAAAHRARR